MENKTQRAVGAMPATTGGLGIVLSLILDWTSLERPWSLLVGFGFGLVVGVGQPFLFTASVCIGAKARGLTSSAPFKTFCLR